MLVTEPWKDPSVWSVAVKLASEGKLDDAVRKLEEAARKGDHAATEPTTER